MIDNQLAKESVQQSSGAAAEVILVSVLLLWARLKSFMLG
jgi:hypothetical protein